MEKLWMKFVDFGYNIRRQKLDGLQSWQPYKKEYSEYIFSNHKEGILMKKKFINFLKSLSYHFTDSREHNDVVIIFGIDIMDNKIETDHFIIQHFRIPKLENYKLSVVKFCQLAYNIGQTKAVFEFENVYDDSVKKFYYQNQLDSIETYFENIDDEIILK